MLGSTRDGTTIHSTGSIAPLDDVADFSASSGYSAPGQDNTRRLYHSWFKEAEQCCEVDAGGEGLKGAVANFENSWYIAAALMMTVGFALLMVVPKGQHPDSVGDTIATFAFISLALFGTINSVLGVWWAGHMVPQVYWHPAAHFSKFWFATMNTSMGQAQHFAKISMQQLVLSLVPFCYLNFGPMGLTLSVISIGYFHMQVNTWSFLMQRMRDAYAEGLERGSPVMDDVSTLPECCRTPFMPGLLGLLTAQLLGMACSSFRWAYAVRRPWCTTKNMQPEAESANMGPSTGEPAKTIRLQNVGTRVPSERRRCGTGCFDMVWDAV